MVSSVVYTFSLLHVFLLKKMPANCQYADEDVDHYFFRFLTDVSITIIDVVGRLL